MASTATSLLTSDNLTTDVSDPLWEPPERTISMTYEQYHNWRGSQRHSEWANGKAIVLMPSSYRHAALVSFLTALLRFYVDHLNLGIVLTAPFEMRLADINVAREPDILFVATENLHKVEDIRVNGPVDLAVEVISDDSSGRDRGQKFDEYEMGGVREYWIADPRPGRLRFDAWARGEGDSLHPILPDAEGRVHSTVIPGFWIRPEWLWEDPLRVDFKRFEEILGSSSPSGRFASTNQ